MLAVLAKLYGAFQALGECMSGAVGIPGSVVKAANPISEPGGDLPEYFVDAEGDPEDPNGLYDSTIL